MPFAAAFAYEKIQSPSSPENNEPKASEFSRKGIAILVPIFGGVSQYKGILTRAFWEAAQFAKKNRSPRREHPEWIPPAKDVHLPHPLVA